MQERELELGLHRLVVSLESLPSTLHLDELLATRQNSRNGCDKTYDLHVVCATADVWKGGANVLDEWGELELGGCGIEDIQTPREGQEGNGKVHGGGVEWVTVNLISLQKLQVMVMALTWST